ARMLPRAIRFRIALPLMPNAVATSSTECSRSIVAGARLRGVLRVFGIVWSPESKSLRAKMRATGAVSLNGAFVASKLVSGIVRARSGFGPGHHHGSHTGTECQVPWHFTQWPSLSCQSDLPRSRATARPHPRRRTPDAQYL